MAESNADKLKAMIREALAEDRKEQAEAAEKEREAVEKTRTSGDKSKGSWLDSFFGG